MSENHSTTDDDTIPTTGSGLMTRLGNISEAVLELLTDPQLRRKAQTLVVSEAGKQIKGLQEGVASRAGSTLRGINEGVPRQIHGLYSRINKQINLNRREASLRARRDQPVDVQVGADLWEDAPQELRSRLWIALLCNPHLIGNLIEEKARCDELLDQRASASNTEAQSSENKDIVDAQTERQGRQEQPAVPVVDSLPNGTPVDTGQPSPSPASPQLEHSRQTREQAGNLGAASDTAEPDRTSDAQPLKDGEAVRSIREAKEGAADNASSRDEGSGDAWELIQESGAWNNVGGSQSLAETLRSSTSDLGFTLKNKLLEAMSKVDWPISVLYQEGCRYDTLCQISVGQEEIEEVIERDIDRTFPEHPQFSFEQGQQQLFRVLKAYSLHDIQVGYCQGMAFVTGVILMYVPEEPAFRLLTRLMDERGANLRHLYLPGLEGLKDYLRMMEWLLEHTDPELRHHLEEYGVSPVLFASQWFLTAFSCPFPASFSCRIIDVMLTENNGHAMLRVALSVMKACAVELMKLHDFESLITHLKVQPVKWSAQTTRNVLNEAVHGYISDAMLVAAAKAVADGYDGSLLRPKSNAEVRESKACADEVLEEGQESSSSPKLTLRNQISAIEPDSSNGLQGVADKTRQGELMKAVDALWLVNAEEA